jgi:acyl-CoA thioesterase
VPDANKDAGWLAMEKETGIPADQVSSVHNNKQVALFSIKFQLADPHLHHWTMRAEALLDELKVPEGVRIVQIQSLFSNIVQYL